MAQDTPAPTPAPTAAAAAAEADAGEEVTVTGTRIAKPGVTSASPITTIGSQELELQQKSEVEQILRDLPATVPGDGSNVNNGTAGISTVDLRSMGEQRTLVLLDGHRMTPANIDGFVDISQVPVALLERVDIVTGGASAVYGSDAVAGAVNFILKKNFEGVAIDTEYSLTGKGDGGIVSSSATVGANLDDDRGNVTLSVNYTNRKPVTLADRNFGLFEVSTADGPSDNGGPPPPAGCDGPGTITVGGSGTTLPARIVLGTSLGRQFRNDGTLAGNCNRFNFNPFNYYQTPQERYQFLATGEYDINEHVTVYGRAMFSNTVVRQQVAPSGVFGDAFDVPMLNPFLTAQARAAIIQDYNVDGYNRALATAAATGQPAPTFDEYFSGLGVTDVNGDGQLDLGDTVNLTILRRTPELGERSTTLEGNVYQILVGVKGDINEDWSYDVSYSHGRSSRVQINAGYTNVTNIAKALNTVSATSCETPSGDTVDGCVPLNLFAGFGTITDEMAAYASATALQKEEYTQDIITGVVSGTLPFTMPWATDGASMAFGLEYRQEGGTNTPDECLKTLPTSCLGGFGGAQLPVDGSFDVYEMYAEFILPIVQDQPGFQELTLELGARYSEYTPGGQNTTYKAGVNWSPIDGLRFRGMFQRAVRAPNVNELFGPIATSLDNATLDPCSSNGILDDDGLPIPGGRVISPELRALCISTGMTNAQVGAVPDISAGQINTFTGTDPNNRPIPETAETLTLGVVFQPDFFGEAIRSPYISVDYYRIQVDDPVDPYAAQDVLDACYEQGQANFCNLIQRVNGNLLVSGSGIQTFTTNLASLEAEGIEVGAAFGVDLDDAFGTENAGRVDFTFNLNWYLTQEFQNVDVLPVTDCLGYYGNACDDVISEFRWNTRMTYSIDDWQFSVLWRHLSGVDILPDQAADVFPDFRSISAYDYFDLAVSYQVLESTNITLSADNIFDKDPPIIGNTTAGTDINSGNTFPSNYDVLGTVYSMGINLRF
ncbi:MAG: TonB-dependent receptor [Alphaproteobacteria bacterium]|nr:TonB-dependent receptor [Alphaproteobacteria bacterium]